MRTRGLEQLFGGLLLATACVACSSDQARDRGIVGVYQDAGSASSAGNARDHASGGTGASVADGGGSTLSVHIENLQKMTIEIVTLACAGDCADVEAVAHGGNAPYAFRWEDGSTDPQRHVCLDADAQLNVSVTDTAVTADEFRYDAHTTKTELTADVLACSDAGMCELGNGEATPQAGHYDGKGTYTCDNDMDPNSAMLINNLTLSLDLKSDAGSVEQTGHVYFQWGLAVIVGAGDLSGTLACGNGELHARVADGQWGIPGNTPMSVVSTGGLTLDLIATRTGDGMIAGMMHWKSTKPDGSPSNECIVTYTATLVP